MTGHVQLRGFRISADHAVTPDTITKSTKEDDSLFGGRFRATRVWNGVIKRFQSEMPVKRHRRQLRVFDNCFTGREAVDFMMSELPKFIYDGREITRFSSVSSEQLAATPVLVRRAASFNERCSFKQTRSRARDFGFTAPQRVHSTGWKNRDNCMVTARMPIPAIQPNLLNSRRLSSSHGNLPAMFSSRASLHQKNPCNELTKMSNTEAMPKETVSQENIKKAVVANMEVGSGASDQINVLDDVIAKLVEVNSNSTDFSGMENLRYFGKIIQTQTPESCHPSASPGAVVDEEHSGAHLFLDTNGIYKKVLLNRLRSLLQVESLKGIIDYDFSGADVRWNCERVGKRGIVRVQPENDYLTTYVITMMRYLSRWPFDTKFAESTHVPYEGFEFNVFKSVCEQFDKDCPVLPSPVALAVLRTIRLFRQRKQRDLELHKETVFCAGNSPFTRYVQKAVTSQNYNKVDRKEGNSSQRTTVSPSKGFIGEEHANSPPNTMRSSVSTLSADGEAFSCRMACEAILTRLPGLQRSPELMQRVEELAKTNDFVLRSSTSSAESSVLLTGIDDENTRLLKQAVSLITLTLEPRVRRRLHYLLRFMQRVSRNYCLRMDKRRDNRSIVLEGLPSKIIRPSQTINASECHQLVIFLMDNECDTFSIPEIFTSEVKQQLLLPHEVVINKSPPVHQPTTDESSGAEPMKQHFCEPIEVEEYESQKKDVNSHLLSLLDGILSDENIPLADRKQRLKKFKKTYPEIYAQRFPSPELRRTRLIDRIKNFHF